MAGYTFGQESAAIAMHNSGNFTPGYAVNKGDLLILTWEGGSSMGATLSISDTTNGAWTVVDHQNDATNGSMACAFVQMTAAVASPGPTISVTAPSDPSVFGYIDQFTGGTGTATLDTTAGSGQYVTFATTQASMVANAQSFFANSVIFAVMHPSQLFSAQPTGWTELANITRYYALEASPTNLGLNQAFNSAATYNVRTFVIYDAPAALIGEGTSTSSTTVATGTGGSAMPAIVVGQVLDVMLMAETSSALTDSGPSDGSNTYFNIRTFDDHVANGYIWDHWGCIVTVPLASPVISTTWSGGTPTKAAIAVGIIPGLIGTNPGVTLSGQAFQTAPSGSNAQVCAIGSSNPTNGIYYTLAGWGYSLNQAAAPAAGTSPIGFNQIGTVWAALGTGACMTFETQTIQGTGAAVEVTFTPVAGNTYTFSAAWQNILGTIIAWIT